MKKPSKEWINLTDENKLKITKYQRSIPVSIGGVAKEFGLIVKVNTLDVGISGMIEPSVDANGGFKITVNKHEIKYRQRFTIAHEISHYLLHREVIGFGLKDNILFRSTLSDEKEAEANRLASDILIPRDILESKIKENKKKKAADYINSFSEEFEVSEEAMRIALGLK